MKKPCLILVLAPLLIGFGMSPAQSQEKRISATPAKIQTNPQTEQREAGSRAAQSSGASGNSAASGGTVARRSAAMERGGYTIDDASEHGPVSSIKTEPANTTSK